MMNPYNINKCAAEEGADKSFTQRAKTRLKEMYNPPADAPESVKYEAKANRAALGVNAAGLGMIGAAKASNLAIAKGYNNLGRQLTNIAALGIPVGMALAGKASYDGYKAWKAKRKENAEETGIYPAEKDNQFYSNRLARDVGMGIGTGVAAQTLKAIADPLVKKRDKRGLALAGLAELAGLAHFGYGARGIYDAYKQYATRPEKTASALETFVATIR